MFAFFFITCKKDNKVLQNVLSDEECFNLKKDSVYLVNNIIGKWKWVSEYKYDQITGEKITKTPSTEGYNKALSFDIISNCLLYKNNNIIETSKYKIARLLEYTLFPTDSIFVIGFHEPNNNVFIKFDYLKPCNDTLILNETAYNDDGSVITYIRNFP